MNKLIIGVVIIVVLVAAYYLWSSSSMSTSKMVQFGCYAATPGATNNFGILGRSSDGTIQCLTADGVNCHWYPDMASCKAGLAGLGSPAAGTPLMCGSTAMTNAWGPVSTTANTWCLQRSDF